MERYLDEDFHIVNSEAITLSAAVAEKGHTTTEIHKGANQAAAAANLTEVEQVKCECCGLAEECTPAYIAHVRGLYCGRWVCGLCAEAVKEEHGRGGGSSDRIKEGMENALEAHMNICMQFNKPEKKGSPVADLASAMKRLLKRSMDRNSSPRSAPSSPRHGGSISRANSCLGPFSRDRGYEAPL